jgi:hypothetical protein
VRSTHGLGEYEWRVESAPPSQISRSFITIVRFTASVPYSIEPYLVPKLMKDGYGRAGELSALQSITPAVVTRFESLNARLALCVGGVFFGIGRAKTGN